MASIEEIANRLTKFRRDLPLLIGAVVVDFALDNFDKQSFPHNSGTKDWPGRKDGRPGAILVGKQSGRLKRSIRVLAKDSNSVTVGSDVPYAGIHNEGGTLLVPITLKSRKFFWAMYYATDELKWKYLALTKKDKLRIDMPERRFIGDSKELDKRLAAMIEKRIEAIFNS